MKSFVHGIRVLARKPGFTSAAIVVLALGIGANAAIFSLINAFLLKPLLLPNPERVVGLYSRNTTNGNYRAFSYPNYADLRAQNGVFSGLAAHNLAMVGYTEGESTRRVFADIVSSNYFDTMGVPLFRGRVFTAEEERPGAGIPVVTLSYSFWKRHGADPAIIGKQVRLNGKLFTVVGIAAEGFTGTTALVSAEVYVPLGVYETLINDFENHNRPLTARDNHALIAIGRLRPGMTLAAADGQLGAAATAMQRAWPAENKDQTLLVRPLGRMSVSDNPDQGGGMGVVAVLLISMASVVLLIASLNVANMMLARGASRNKEIAIRLALGGGRRDIVRQLLSESLILALVGGAAGLLIAWWSTELLVRSLSRLAPLDLVYSGTPDIRVLAATFGFCLLSTLVFGFMPAWNLSRPNLTADLKNGERGGGSGRLFSRGNLLVMGQMCLSLAMLTAAGLFIRSAVRAASAAPGFRVSNSVIVEIDPSLAGYDPVRGKEAYRALLARFRALPGVESASTAATVPYGFISLGRSIQRLTDDPADKHTQVYCASNIVEADYFRTMGIPLLRGRSFLPAEAAAGNAVMLDRGAAARLWPNGDALGKRLRLLGGDTGSGREVEVVGVVGDVQEHIIPNDSSPHVYLPFGREYQANMNFHLKAGPGVIDGVRREIRGYDPSMPVLAIRTMQQHMEASFDFWITRTGAVLFTIFGGVALVLAVIGLYGIRAYSVARRTREIGIRMALGANPSDTLGLVLREGAAVTAAGAAAGLALSLLTGKLLAGFLYQVSGADPVVFLTATGILSAVSLLACYVPARRAARVDPMIALRYE
jgi:predicted permease